ncbi:MAG: ABC transporter substrate-binding protein, partial [Anaerolineae bacterium]|nr:ABC transporter substrate-binding protein [Anaerolineae bacterium]
ALIITAPLTASAQGGGTLRVGLNSPVTLDPALGSNDSEVFFNNQVYDYLVDVLPDGNLAPSLAADWSISEDGLTYTFMLVEEVTFHDGSPFTAADVVFTFERLQAVESSALGLLGDFTVAAEDDYTVVFTLTAPNADFLFGVGSRFALILKEGTSEPNVLGENGGLQNFNGTGPFVLTAYNSGENAAFTRNENYWAEGQPELDSLELIFIEESSAQIDALRSGTVDFIFKIPDEQIPVLETAGDLNILVQSTNTHPVIRLRSDEGHLGADPRVRLAFKHATDRELLNLDVMDGMGIVGNNDPIGPVYGPYYTPQDVQPYDPALACQLIGEAGYVDGSGNPRLEVEFYVADAFNFATLAQFMQQQWQDACIYAELLIRPENIYYGDNEWMEVDLSLTGWASRPVPQEYLSVAYASDAIYNESHWSDAELDALIDEAAITADPEARAEIYARISAIFNERGPVLIPFFRPVYGATSSAVTGLELHSFPGRTDLRTVSVGG